MEQRVFNSLNFCFADEEIVCFTSTEEEEEEEERMCFCFCFERISFFLVIFMIEKQKTVAAAAAAVAAQHLKSYAREKPTSNLKVQWTALNVITTCF